MSTDEYVPSDGDLYEQIAKRRYEYDYTSPWEHLAPAPRKLLTQAARNTMEPIIARVRRDAAREALDGLIADTAIDVRLGTEGNDPKRVQDAEAVMDAAHIYRITEYPEETP